MSSERRGWRRRGPAPFVFEDLSGKIVIVTGGSQGQGAAEARLFAEAGAKVIIADVADESGQAVAAEIGASYCHAGRLEMHRIGGTS